MLGDTARSFAERLAGFDIPPELLRQALSHRSYCAESPPQASNERLELLGDSVLGVVVTDHLFAAFPELPEGDLARVRAAVVSTLALAPVAESLGIGDALLLGKGEDCLEAVIGAVYLSAGITGARRFVLGLLLPRIAAIASEARLGDPKNRLQELAAQMVLGMPTYLMDERGPDHAKHFTARALVAGEHLGTGDGRSKKDAERRAAEEALGVLLERWQVTTPLERIEQAEATARSGGRLSDSGDSQLLNGA
jgi:ribonuclease-3